MTVTLGDLGDLVSGQVDHLACQPRCGAGGEDPRLRPFSQTAAGHMPGDCLGMQPQLGSDHHAQAL